MNQDFDSPDSRPTPSDISKTVGGFKVSSVVVEVFDDYNKRWERASTQDMDSLMSMMFDLSLAYDIIGIEAYGLQKEFAK